MFDQSSIANQVKTLHQDSFDYAIDTVILKTRSGG